MKTVTLVTMSLVFASSLAQAASRGDVCENAVYSYAVKQQHADYPGREWKKSQPGNPQVEQAEVKSNGFEIYNIQYGVNEECLEGYTVLVRRAQNGKSCAVIKQASNSSQDCG